MPATKGPTSLRQCSIQISPRNHDAMVAMPSGEHDERIVARAALYNCGAKGRYGVLGGASGMIAETIVLQGHIIDSLLLPKVLDQILNEGGEFEIEEVHIGRQRADPSHARILVRAPDENAMEALLTRLAAHGAHPIGREELMLADADQDGVFPEGFHVTTNLETSVRYQGKWLPVEGIEMDCGIVVDPALGVARCTPMHRIRKGDKVVVGHSGVRVTPLERQGRGQLFEFMGSDISPEKPKWAMVQALAQELFRARAAGRKTALVGHLSWSWPLIP